MNTNYQDLSRTLTSTGLALVALLPATQANAQKPTAATPKSGKAASIHAPASVAPSAANCVTLKLQGLDCPICAHQVQQSLMRVVGVQSAEVSAAKQTAVVRLAAGNQPKNEALTAAVKKVGFGVTAVERGGTKSTKKPAGKHV